MKLTENHIKIALAAPPLTALIFAAILLLALIAELENLRALAQNQATTLHSPCATNATQTKKEI